MTKANKFETVYRNAREWSKAQGFSLDGFMAYSSFRNETCVSFGVDMDYIPNDGSISQAKAVYDKIKSTMSFKEMCRQFFYLKQAEL